MNSEGKGARLLRRIIRTQHNEVSGIGRLGFAMERSHRLFILEAAVAERRRARARSFKVI